MAMRWVRDNIRQFGGDPDNITLIGESAGGCSVHYHMLSPLSKGLFHKAIMMSGTALNSWSQCYQKNLPERLARAVGWNGEGGTQQMIRHLRTVKMEAIIRAQDGIITKEVLIGRKELRREAINNFFFFYLKELRQYIMFPFGPVRESYVAPMSMISSDPAQMSQNAWSHQMPTMFSACADEGLLLYKSKCLQKQYFC